MAKVIYLDHAAATPLDKEVLAAMQPFFSDQFYNPSATYLAAKKVSRDITEARAKIAHWLGCRPTEVIFTAGGTEANNLAIQGVLQQFSGSNAVISAIEHDSVLEPAQNYPHKLVKVDGQGVLDLKDLTKQIDDKTVLVSVMYANNEIGTIQPIREIVKIIDKIKAQRQTEGNNLPLYFHTDACQAANYLDLHTDRLGVDLMTVNGGKIYGPKQSGALYLKTGVQLKPQILGGGQENNRRSGTENVPAIVGLAAALDKAQNLRAQESQRLRALRDHFIKLLSELPTVEINGSLKARLPNNVHATFTGTDNETLMMQLDEKGVICAVGSACSASSEEPSHVLKTIGLSDQQAQSSLRFTLGRATTRDDIEQTVQAIKAVFISR